MNPWDLSSSDLLIWGIALHWVGDFFLQNEWMAQYKSGRGTFKLGGKWRTNWFIRHPAAYVHAGIHTFLLACLFGWPAFFLGVAHLIIDCRWIVVKWSKLIKQTQPNEPFWIGGYVRMQTDQVFHILCLMVAALLVA